MLDIYTVTFIGHIKPFPRRNENLQEMRHDL